MKKEAVENEVSTCSSLKSPAINAHSPCFVQSSGISVRGLWEVAVPLKRNVSMLTLSTGGRWATAARPSVAISAAVSPASVRNVAYLQHGPSADEQTKTRDESVFYTIRHVFAYAGSHQSVAWMYPLREVPCACCGKIPPAQNATVLTPPSQFENFAPRSGQALPEEGGAPLSDCRT